MKMQEPLTYPFTAIVSLDDLKLALILNAINPRIGGLLVRGSKGSGKTTAVRSLTQIVSKVKTAKDCPFNCNPDDQSNMCDRCRTLYSESGSLPFTEKKMRVVELPLGATEDRVIGSLDVEKAIKLGIEALEAGILAEANQNILYVDEINLLPDHVADDLLDAAATGWNVVEREGISVKHPSRFILIGTMNPEEGQIRPQLLDRLPLSVEVHRIFDAKDRLEIVKRNIEYEDDPETFVKKYDSTQEQLKERIVQARKTLPNVKISDRFVKVVCESCLELKVDGMRPDIVITKTAKTLAAFANRKDVVPEDIFKAAELSLSHRTREGGFLEPATPQEIKDSLLTRLQQTAPEDEEKPEMDKVKQKKDKGEQPSQDEKRKVFPPFGLRKKMSIREKLVGKARKLEGTTSGRLLVKDSNRARADFLFDSKPEKGGKNAVLAENSEWPRPKMTRGTAFIDRIRESTLVHFRFLFKTRSRSKHSANSVGKRAEAVTAIHRGRTRGWKIPRGKPSDIYFPATIRAAAKMGGSRKKPYGVVIPIRNEDIREKRRIYRAPMTMVFVLDLSESMLHSIHSIKEIMLKLHNDAYRYRDKVGLVTFKEMGAVVIQHPTSNLKMVTNKLLRLRMSGFTPLATGMYKALEVLKECKHRDLSTIPVMVIVTDGDANVPLRRDLQTGEVREFSTGRALNPLDVAFFKYEDEAVKDVVSVSQLIRREDIYTVVINVAPIGTHTQTTSGSFTTTMIASFTNGLHYELSGSIFAQSEQPMIDFSHALHRAQKAVSEFHYLSARGYLMHEANFK